MNWKRSVNPRAMTAHDFVAFASPVIGAEGGYVANVYRHPDYGISLASKWGLTVQAALEGAIKAFDPQAVFLN